MDGGNEVYMNIIPQWDGEDECFDLKICNSLNAIQRASKPEANPTQYLVPMYEANSSSNEETSCPNMYKPERSTSKALFSNSF